VMKTRLRGGLSRFVTGESIFINEFTAQGGPGEIGIAPGAPGDLRHVYLDDQTIYLQNSAYCASGSGVAVESKWQGLMKGFFSGDVQRHSGSMIAADFNLCEKARRNFDHAMITEIAFPKLDGGDKGSCYMNVTLCAETVTYQEGKNEKLKENLKQAQKSWSPCNFSFSIDGFEDACRRVTKVDGFSIKQKPIDYAHGNLRAGLKMAGRVEIPNISFYLPEADAQPFIKHHEKFVIGGSAEQPQLKGTIECYDHWGMQNKGGAIFWIDFMDATLFAVTHDKSDAGGEDIKQVKVELGVEKMDFFYPLMELQ